MITLTDLIYPDPKNVYLCSLKCPFLETSIDDEGHELYACRLFGEPFGEYNPPGLLRRTRHKPCCTVKPIWGGQV